MDVKWMVVEMNVKTRLVVRLVALLLSLGALGGAMLLPQTADAQSEIDGQLQKKLDSAIEDYDFLQIQDAEKKLEEAVALAERNGVETSPVLANVYVMLGIVRFAATRDEAVTEDIFVQGVEADANVDIDPVYQTPTLKDIMARARKRAKPKTSDTPPPSAGDGLTHEPIQTADAGKDLEVEALTPVELPVYKVFLHYRGIDQTDYKRAEMEPTSNTRFAVTIPGNELTSSQLEYYILAEDRGGNIIDQKGSPDNPLSIVMLGSSDVDDTDSGDDEVDDDEPDAPGTSRQWVYLTLLGGTDFGFLPGGSPTANPEREVNPGFVPAFGHMVIDAGVRITNSAHLGIFFRWQFAPAQDFTFINTDPGSGFWDTEDECLGLGLSGDCILGFKYKWFFSDSEPLKLYSSAGTGVGRVRNWLRLKEDATSPACAGKAIETDSNGQEICFVKDTVRTGWLHFGVGGGLAYELTDFLDLTADAYLMLLVPDTSLNLDVSGGLTFRF